MHTAERGRSRRQDVPVGRVSLQPRETRRLLRRTGVFRWILAGTLAWGALPSAPLLAKTPASAKTKAQDLQAKATALNEQARQAFKDGRFDEAADLFLQVYDLVRTPTAVFNAARAREAAGKLPEAKALFELFLRIEKSAEGQEDARKRIAAIDTTLQKQAEDKQRQEQEARAKVEAEAQKARQEAEASARKAEQERQELERFKAQEAERLKAAEAQKQKALADERARAEAAAKAATELAGVTFLPPTGASTEDTVRTVQALLQTSMLEAQSAQVAPVHPVADYIQAEMARNLPAACDFHCQLGLARSLGSAYAVTTALRYESGQVRVRQVLWRTLDATDAASVEVTAWTLAGLQQRARLVGDLWNPVRRFAIQPTQGPPGARPQLEVVSDPRGAVLTFDEVDVGLTPMAVTCEPGTHRLKLTLAGRAVRAGTVVTAAGSQRLTVALPALLPAEPAPNPADPNRRDGNPRPDAVRPDAVRPDAVRSGPTPKRVPTPTTEGGTPARQVPPATNDASTSWRWGLAGSVEGGAALIEDANKSIQPDVSGGIGTFGHLGYGSSDGPAWVSLALGVRYLQFQGLSTPTGHKSAAPHGASGWLGVQVPSIDLLVSLHRTWVSVDNGLHDFSYDTAQVRVLQGKGWFFIAFGVEALLGSTRPAGDLDEFGKGPNLRLTLELGLNGGAPLFK